MTWPTGSILVTSPAWRWILPGTIGCQLSKSLNGKGFEVILMNARYAKNLSGRKTDVSDVSWLRQLLSYGPLQGKFQPEAEIAPPAHILALAGTLGLMRRCPCLLPMSIARQGIAQRLPERAAHADGADGD
jgi:hypothetical protein